MHDIIYFFNVLREKNMSQLITENIQLFEKISQKYNKQTMLLITNLTMIARLCRGISTKIRFYSSTSNQQ